MSEFGVEDVKKVLLWGAKLSVAVVEAIVDDGKIDFGEGIGIGLKAVGIPVKSFKPMIAQLKDMDETEQQEIVDAFVEAFDLTNEEAEVKIEQTVAFILSLVAVITVKPNET